MENTGSRITDYSQLSGNREIVGLTNLCWCPDAALQFCADSCLRKKSVLVLECIRYWPGGTSTSYGHLELWWFQSLSGTSHSSQCCVFPRACVLACDNTDWLTDADEDNKWCRWRGSVPPAGQAITNISFRCPGCDTGEYRYPPTYTTSQGSGVTTTTTIINITTM